MTAETRSSRKLPAESSTTQAPRSMEAAAEAAEVAMAELVGWANTAMWNTLELATMSAQSRAAVPTPVLLNMALELIVRPVLVPMVHSAPMSLAKTAVGMQPPTPPVALAEQEALEVVGKVTKVL